MIEESDKFGVVLILPECSFSAELSRTTIPEMMKDIDEKLTEQGAPEETEARCGIMMDNALALSSMVAHQQVDHASGVADIAYSFVYAFGKSIGFENMDDLRGLTGSYVRNKLRLNPCLGEIDFQAQATFLTKKMEEHEARDDDVWDFDISFPPTLH
jgi:hypothetical protein